MSEAAFSHIPVLLQQCLEGLAIDPKKNYLDGTVGGAGHSLPIAGKLRGGWLYCLDKDPTAVSVAAERLAGLPATVIEGDFRNAAALLPEGITLAGALLDLGVSSYQLDEAERGFSYHEDAPLDMRMSQNGKSARDVVNGYEVSELARIFRTYADEPFALPIAKKIAQARERSPIETTLQLAGIVASAVPSSVRRKEKHPARRVFQAVRMEVNDELAAEREGICSIFELLEPGGRLCVISFHSIEDRLIKSLFNEFMTGCICPPDFPVCVCGRKPRAKAVSRKPITADEAELAVNPRSRSAKLRILEKL